MKKLEGAMAEPVPAQVNMSADEIVRLLRSLSLGLFQALLHVLQSATTDKGIVRLEVTRPKLEGLLIRFAAELRAPLGLGAVEGGSHDILLQLAFCLVLALAPSLSDAREVSIHEETRDQLTYGGEKAVEVLYTALASQRWSNAVRRLTITGDGGAFGTDRGCEHLAHLLLKAGHCKLQEIHMRMTATGAGGVSHIAQALETNTSLIVLCLQGCPEVGDGGVKELATMLLTNGTLLYLTLSNIGMTAEGLLHLCRALSTPQLLQAISTMDTHVRGVKTLDISQNQIGEGGAAHLGKMLANNRCLRSLRVDSCSLAEEGIDGEGHFAKGLRANSTLEELNISDNPRLGKAALGLLARSLATNNKTTLGRLEMGNMVEMPAAEELAHMIVSNQSLKHLGLQYGSYSADEWATVILPALRRNKTLLSVDLKYCKGVEGEQVRAALFDLLRNTNIRINTTIQEILLRGTLVRGTLVEDGAGGMVLRDGQDSGTMLLDGPKDVPTDSSSIMGTGGKRKRSWSKDSTSLSTPQIKEIASQLSHHPHVHDFFRHHVKNIHQGDGTSVFTFECEVEAMRELGEVVAAAHQQTLPLAQGCSAAVALALSALPCGNHFSKLLVDVPRNSGSAPFLAILADANTCVLEGLTFGTCADDWFRRKAEWSLLAHLILHNTTLKSLQLVAGLEKMSEKGGIALADSIRNNRGLKELHIVNTDAFGTEGGGLALAAVVRHKSTLRILHLSNVALSSEGTEALAKALRANRGLRELVFTFDGWSPLPVGSAIAGLSHCVLKSLDLCVHPAAADAMIKLLTTSKPGSADGVRSASSANICQSLQKLALDVHPLDDKNMNGMDASAAADMIRSNQKLVRFTLKRATYSSLEWADTIIPALESNSLLQKLHINDCQGVDAERAYNALIWMLSNNNTLESIDLIDTPLSRAGKAEAVMEELRRNVEYRSTLAALPKIKAKSCRLVLFGSAFAGKTTLCSTMLRLQPGNRTRFQATRDQMGSQKDTKEQERTRGFEVNLLIDEDHLRVAIWDFAGQPFYYALHDSVFPSVNGSTISLFAFSPIKDVVHTSGHLDHLTSQHLKSMQDFEDEFRYWLRFVSSNSRRRPSQPHLPSVVVVITFQDCTTELLAPTYPEVEFLEKVDALQAEFKGFVHILGQPEFLDARSEIHVQPFLERLRERFVNLVFDLPPVPAIYGKTRLHLEAWCSEHYNCPLMEIQDFKQIIQDLCAAETEDPALSPEEREQMVIFKSLEDKNWKVVALSLHDTGEVIYFDGLMDFIVVNPRWLGQGVMGHLVEEFSPYDHLNRRKLTFHEKKQGFVTTQGLKGLLEASLRKVGLSPTVVTTDKLIQLLCNLHLCYARKDEYGRDGYFILVLFAVDDKVHLIDRQLEWPSQSDDVEHHLFFGARLECANSIQTFLTPGLFSRIQALLYDAGKKKGWDEAGTKMDVHLYGVSTSGYDVLLEYSDSSFHIDFLVRSSTRDHFSSRNFIYQNFIKPIRSFCASQEGCMGVYLTEGVLRQECVRRRTSCRYRQKQCVSKEDLKKRVLNAEGHVYVHQWFAVKDQNQDGDLKILEARLEYATLVVKNTIPTISKEGEVDKVVILGSRQEIESLTQGDVPSNISDRLDNSKSNLLAFQEVTEECYPDSNVMQGKRRGLAVLISMEGNRSRALVDQVRLETLAESLGFEVNMHTFFECAAHVLQKEMKDTAELDISVEDECFVCFLNGHGGTSPEGAHFIVDANGNKLFLLNDIVEPFRKCENLLGKPKVFFINSCRGPLKLASTHGSGGVAQQSPQLWSEGKEVHHVRRHSDCLLVFSTSDQASSMRGPKTRTSFVYELMQALCRQRQTKDVLSIIGGVIHTVVNEEKEEKDGEGNLVGTYSQCPIFVSSLTKKLYWRTVGSLPQPT